MTDKKVKFPIAAIFFALSMIYHTIGLVSMLPYIEYVGVFHQFTVLSNWLLYVFLFVLLLMRKRSLAFPAAFAGLVAVGFLTSVGSITEVSARHVQYMMVNILQIIPLLTVGVVSYLSLRETTENGAGTAVKLWFLPGILQVVYFAIVIFADMYSEVLIIRSSILCVALFLIGHWFAYPYQTRPVYEGAEGGKDGAQPGEFYQDMTMHVVLLLVTGGIWTLIWIYRATRFGNRAKGYELYNPTSKLLLYMFVPFYSIYWFAKQGQRLDVIAHEAGDREESATMYLLLGIFIPVVAAIMMQSRINKIERGEYANRPAPAYAQPPYAPQPQAMPQETSLTEKINEIKALLDAGLITEDEFNEKKRQVLGL